MVLQFHIDQCKLTNNAEYYFYAIIGVIIFAGISILIGIGLIIWKIVKYCSLENQRYEIEKFVVACYVEKLEKISKIPIGNEKPKSKKKKKRISPSESRSASYHSHHHHRRHRRRSQRSVTESVSKIPHGSKILPLPNEKDLFASDRKKVELKPVAIQEPRKEKTGRRDPSKGSNTSVCSLKSVTQSVDDSLDWTGKGVRVSQRKPALQLYKEDQTKDEDEAYKLGMNLSTFKRKKKRQQHGSQQDDEESKKKQKTQYPLSVASGMSSYTKPMPPIATTVTATPVPPTSAPTTITVATTNSKLLRGDQTAQDEARFQRAEKELQDRVEAQQKQQQQQAKNPGGGRASVYLGNNNPYGSLSVPMGPPDVFPQNKK
uniref:Uncharacterized protein n=1 Tax=Panagrolaimus superbus TaxID=310955 RepID=A0A914YSE9_9BILA